MNVKECIFKRRSIRKFQDTKVSDEIIKELLECAMAAPSACNKRPWVFYVIQNEEILEQLKHAARYSNYNAPLTIVVCGDTSKSISEKENDFWIQDCSSAIENMLLYATSIELGSLWCGLYPMKTPVDNVSEILNLPKNHIPLGLIHFGYPDEIKESRTQYEEECVKIIK